MFQKSSQKLRNVVGTVLVICVTYSVVLLICGCTTVEIARTGCAGELSPASPPYENVEVRTVICDNGSLIQVEVPTE